MNNKPIDLTVKADELVAAGKTTEGDLSPLSPFLNESSAAPSTELMKNGAVKPAYHQVFKTLAQADRMGACSYIGADGLLDTSIYTAPDGPAVSLAMADDGVRIQSPVNAIGILEWLAQQNGVSMVSSCEFKAELSMKESAILFAVVDAARRKAMGVMSGSDGDFTPITAADVIFPDVDETDLQWLAPHFTAAYEMSKLDGEILKKGIQRLAQKGFVSLEKQNIILSDALQDLASKFMLLEGHLRLRLAEADKDGTVKMTDVRGVRGRGNAVLIWTDNGRTGTLQGASPAQVMAIARNILGVDQESHLETVSATAPAPPSKMDRSVQSTTPKVKKKRKFRWWMIPLILLVLYLIFEVVLWLSV